MMFEVEMLVLALLKEEMERLVNDSEFMEDIFGWMHCPEYDSVFKDSQKYYNQAIDMLKKKDLKYHMMYQNEQKANNYVVSYSTGNEEILALGDYGKQYTLPKKQSVRANFSVTDVKSNTFKTFEELPRGARITNNLCPSWEAKITDCVWLRDSEPSTYFLDREPPVAANGQPILSGYQLMGCSTSESTIVHGSTDAVNVNILLGTTGHYSTHYLIKSLMRIALKKLRPVFDSRNFQIATLSYSEATPDKSPTPNAVLFQSTFHLHGKASDRWIASSYDRPDSITVNAYPTKDYTDETTVKEVGVSVEVR